MQKKYIIHALLFISLHLFGGLTLLSTTLTSISFQGNAGNFDIGKNLFNLSTIYLLQYLLVCIFSSFIFVYIQIKFANMICNKLDNTNQSLLHMLWAAISYSSLIALNNHLFPETVFNIPPPVFLQNSTTNLYVHISILAISAIAVGMVFTMQHKVSSFLFFVGLTSFLFVDTEKPLPPQKKPNIIFIGIDSLRPELIGKYMPYLSQQLSQSAVFDNAYTSFARTYPSWMSIVTGRHPVNHNARYNLQSESTLDEKNTYLADILKNEGYQTIYASDERRFSNLGQAQGFDMVIGPRTGVSDFVLGNYSDFPIMNLINLIPPARILTPELYGNRAAKHLYRPKQFSDLLNRQLNTITDKPLFLAVHFCLPHWPYSFIGQYNDPTYPKKPSYPANLQYVDKQIESLLNYLDRRGALENSKLVFLSDHGESWGRLNTGLKNPKGEPLFIFDYGHGMNILSQASHKVLMAFKGFPIQTKKSKRLTSLQDIKPTVLDALNIDYSALTLDGHSLTKPTPSHVEIAFESGFIPIGANTKNPDTKKIAQSEAHRYKILNNGMLRLKQSQINNMIAEKQLGLRINEFGLFKGRFTQPEVINFSLIDYKEEQYISRATLAELKALFTDKAAITDLLSRYCDLYSFKHKALQMECKNL